MSESKSSPQSGASDQELSKLASKLGTDWHGLRSSTAGLPSAQELDEVSPLQLIIEDSVLATMGALRSMCLNDRQLFIDTMLPDTVKACFLNPNKYMEGQEESKQFFIDLVTVYLCEFASQTVKFVTDTIVNLYHESLTPDADGHMPNNVDIRDELVDFIDQLAFIPRGQVKPIMAYLAGAINGEINRIGADTDALEDSLIGGVLESLLTITEQMAKKVAQTYNQMTPASAVADIFPALKEFASALPNLDNQQLISSFQDRINTTKATFKAEEPVGFREKPEFKGASLSLDQKLQEVWQHQPTAKLWLWKNATEARKALEDKGSSLESWLNLSNPETTLESFNKFDIDSLPPRILKNLNKHLLQSTGLALTSFSEKPAQLKVLGDEFLQALSTAAVETSTYADELQKEFTAIINALKEAKLDIENKTARNPARVVKSKVGALRGFIKTHGINLDLKIEATKGDYLEMLNQLITRLEENQGAIEKQLEVETKSIKLELAQIIEGFNLKEFGKKHQQGFFISRRPSDQYLGDQCNDCTAYTLETGMNAWTVPVWLSHPGFNFYIIPDANGQMMAKMGLFLTETNEGQLSVLMDSVELAKNWQNLEEKQLEELKQAIQSGIQQLISWVSERGFGQISFSGVSNHDWLSKMLIKMTSPPTQEQPRHLFRNLADVAAIAGDDSTEVSIYLQSRVPEEDKLVVSALLTKVEREVFNPLFTSLKQVMEGKEVESFQDQLRSYGWDKALTWLMTNHFTEFAEYVGNQWPRFRILSDPFIKDDERLKLAEGNEFWLWVVTKYFKKNTSKRLTDIVQAYIDEQATLKIGLGNDGDGDDLSIFNDVMIEADLFDEIGLNGDEMGVGSFDEDEEASLEDTTVSFDDETKEQLEILSQLVDGISGITIGELNLDRGQLLDFSAKSLYVGETETGAKNVPIDASLPAFFC